MSDTERLEEMLDDDDVSIGVSSELYARTFDEVVTEPISIPEEDRAVINYYMFEPDRTSLVIRHISRGIEVSFNMITQMALYHGFSIFEHKHGSTIQFIEALEEVALDTENTNYMDHRNYQMRLPSDKKRMTVRTDRITADALGQLAGILGCSRTHIASICIYYSLVTCYLIPAFNKRNMLDYLKEFELGLSYRSEMDEVLIK